MTGTSEHNPEQIAISAELRVGPGPQEEVVLQVIVASPVDHVDTGIDSFVDDS